MIAVVITTRNAAADALLSCLLPTTLVVTSAERCYSVFDIDGDGAEGFVFTDPIDGEVLTECRTFPSLAAAKSWIAEDVRGDHA